MAIAKEKMKEVIESQPEDATYKETLHELTFVRMVERGLVDSRSGHMISFELTAYPSTVLQGKLNSNVSYTNKGDRGE